MNRFERIHLRLPPDQIEYVDRQTRGVESRSNYIRRLIEEDRQFNERRRPQREEQG